MFVRPQSQLSNCCLGRDYWHNLAKMHGVCATSPKKKLAKGCCWLTTNGKFSHHNISSSWKNNSPVNSSVTLEGAKLPILLLSDDDANWEEDWCSELSRGISQKKSASEPQQIAAGVMNFFPVINGPAAAAAQFSASKRAIPDWKAA